MISAHLVGDSEIINNNTAQASNRQCKQSHQAKVVALGKIVRKTEQDIPQK